MIQEQIAPTAAKSRPEEPNVALTQMDDSRSAVRTSTADEPANQNNLEDELDRMDR